VNATDAGIAQYFADGQDTLTVIGGLYLAPFSCIMFLWFIAVIRDRVGEREDRFFATIFFGSGVIFVALVFAATAAASSLVIGVRYLDQPPPPAASVQLMATLAYTLLFVFATRAAAVFLFSAATIGLRSRTFPNWIAWMGILLAIVLLVVVAVWDWIILEIPIWVAIASLFMLSQARRTRRNAA
jgi:hypothetical protein